MARNNKQKEEHAAKMREARARAKEEAEVQIAAGKNAIAEKEAAGAVREAEKQAMIQKQNEGKVLLAEEQAKLAEAREKSNEEARVAEAKIVTNRENARREFEENLEKAVELSEKEELEISVRKSEAAVRRAPVLAKRDENRGGRHPMTLKGKSKAIEDECNRQLQKYNMIINSVDGKGQMDVLS